MAGMHRGMFCCNQFCKKIIHFCPLSIWRAFTIPAFSRACCNRLQENCVRRSSGEFFFHCQVSYFQLLALEEQETDIHKSCKSANGILTNQNWCNKTFFRKILLQDIGQSQAPCAENDNINVLYEQYFGQSSQSQSSQF